MFKKKLLILFIICCSNYSSGFLDELFKAAKKATKIVMFLNDAAATKDTALDFVSFFTDSDNNREVMEKLEGIENDFKVFTSYTIDKLDEMNSLMKALPNEIIIRNKKQELVSFIAKTDDKWELLISAVENNYSINALNDITFGIINSIDELLSDFRQNLTPSLKISSSDEGFFMLVAKHGLEAINTLCDEGETFHTTLARFFQIVIQTEIKAHILISFARNWRWSKHDGTYFTFIQMNKEIKFRQQFNRYVNEFSRSLNNAKLPYVRACDPKDSWRRDETFLELEGFLQQTVYRRNKRCDRHRLTCSNLRVEAVERRGCFMLALSQHSACDGEPHNCENMNHPTKDTKVCLWNEGIHRIRYVTYKKVTTGTDTVNNCPASDYHLHKRFQWVATTPPFCRCQCRSSKWKLFTRLLPSRFNDNYVVVGVRLKKILNFIYIQIAEGKLGPDSYVSNFSWVPVTKISTVERLHDDIVSVEMSRRSFFFDDLQLPPGYISTGIQFVSILRNKIRGFGIGINGVQFDYATGKLDITNELFVTASPSESERELTYRARNSIHMDPYENHKPDSDGYTYLTLQQSEIEDDFGQSTLPLFDSTPIVTQPLSPIGGIGLFHKGYPDYAGFLSLRLYAMNYMYFMDTFLQTHNLSLSSTWVE